MPSGVKTYLSDYKVTSLEILTNDTKTVTSRSNITLLDILSNIGGLQGFIYVFFNMIVGWFALPTVSTLYANRLYTWHKPATEEQADGSHSSKKTKKIVKASIIYIRRAHPDKKV